MWLVQVCRNSLFHIGFLLIEKFLQVDAVNVDVLDFEGSLNSFAGSGGLHLGFCSSSALLFLHQKKNQDMFSIFYQKCKKKFTLLFGAFGSSFARFRFSSSTCLR